MYIHIDCLQSQLHGKTVGVHLVPKGLDLVRIPIHPDLLDHLTEDTAARSIPSDALQALTQSFRGITTLDQRVINGLRKMEFLVLPDNRLRCWLPEHIFYGSDCSFEIVDFPVEGIYRAIYLFGVLNESVQGCGYCGHDSAGSSNGCYNC
jgi:hypothetical protein